MTFSDAQWIYVNDGATMYAFSMDRWRKTAWVIASKKSNISICMGILVRYLRNEKRSKQMCICDVAHSLCWVSYQGCSGLAASSLNRVSLVKYSKSSFFQHHLSCHTIGRNRSVTRHPELHNHVTPKSGIALRHSYCRPQYTFVEGLLSFAG